MRDPLTRPSAWQDASPPRRRHAPRGLVRLVGSRRTSVDSSSRGFHAAVQDSSQRFNAVSSAAASKEQCRHAFAVGQGPAILSAATGGCSEAIWIRSIPITATNANMNASSPRKPKRCKARISMTSTWVTTTVTARGTPSGISPTREHDARAAGARDVPELRNPLHLVNRMAPRFAAVRPEQRWSSKRPIRLQYFPRPSSDPGEGFA